MTKKCWYTVLFILLSYTRTAAQRLPDSIDEKEVGKTLEYLSSDQLKGRVNYTKEQLQAAQESYAVASEKYTQEIMNAVDLLIQKTNTNIAESNYLQAKYNLIFSYKTLDFYLGIPFNF